MTGQASTAGASRSPFGFPVFRALWIATVVSNIGTWMHDVGAGWLMTDLSASPLMVALVQAAATLPVFLLGLPAGAVADIVDRRRLLLAAQTAGLVAAGVLAAVTALGHMTGPLLLTLTVLLGASAALSAPAFQAIVPDLVDRPSLPAAIALNSLGVNLARAVGPALGGVVVALAGPPAVFAINALSVLAILFVLHRWPHRPPPALLPPERFFNAIQAGARYARGSSELRTVLIRAAGFFPFGSAVWALLPLVARRQLGLDAGGYGFLLGTMGAGAVAGALLLPRLRQVTTPNTLSLAATALFAAAALMLAAATSFPGALAAMIGAGLAWIAMLTSLNVAAQQASAGWVKARALSTYLVVVQGAMTGGAVLWGAVATDVGVDVALGIAAAGQVLAATIGFRWPLPRGGADLAPSGHWPDPGTPASPGDGEGPVLVLIEYQVAPQHRGAFLALLRRFAERRRRDGATRCEAWGDVADAGRIVETFVVGSWMEHRRQHARATEADRHAQAELNGWHVGAEPPLVRHLVAPGRGAAGIAAEDDRPPGGRRT